MQYTQICLQCDGPVQKPRNLYCSKECRSVALTHVDKIEIPCDACGAILFRRPNDIKSRNYCDMKCLGEGLRHNHVCEMCGTSIRHLSAASRFCEECFLLDRRMTIAGNPTRNRKPRITISCPICETSFEVLESELNPGRRDGPRRACSTQCAYELRRQSWPKGPNSPLFIHDKPIIICGNCGIEFETKPSLAKRTKFCSRHCAAVWRSANVLVNISSIELKVAAELDRRGIEYDQQVMVAGWVPDFLVGDTIVEVDGDYWHNLPHVKVRDIRKNATYKKMGIPFIRIWEHEVNAGDFSKLDVLVS